MPTQSIRLEFSHGYLYAIWFPIGILLGLLVTILASQGYLPDPLSFLNDSLLDLSSEQADWFTIMVKTLVLTFGILSLIIIAIKSSQITALYISEEKTIVHRSQTSQTFATSSIQNLQYTPTSKGDYKAQLFLGANTLRFKIGSYQREKLDRMISNATQSTTKLAPSASPAVPLKTSPVETESIDYKLLKLINNPDDNKADYKRLVFLLLSLGAFMLAGGYRWGLAYTVLIAVALFIHELGHVLAMVVFKYKNISMLFLPFLGAVASGRPQKRNASKNALISIAGPALGVFAGAACTFYYPFAPHEYLYKFIVISYFINAFNLIPFKPLDGGHYLNAVLFSRFPIGQLLFDLTAAAGVGYIAYQFESLLFAAIALFTLFGTPHRFTLAKLSQRLRSDPRINPEELDLKTVAFIRKTLTETIPSLAKKDEKGEKLLAKSITNLWDETRAEHPKVFISALLLLLYFATIAAILFLFYYARGIYQAIG